MAEESNKQMNTIGDLLTRDLSRKIEEIIQVDQADEQSVHDEITEYIATDSIREQYHHLLKAIAEAPSDPHESVGVWISGFFGSGKSSFAKNLGYALENRTVLGSKFADLFKQQLGDTLTSDLLDLINAKTPTEVILFEVAKEADTRKLTQRIAELMYTVLLRELGYSEDFDIAELEIELEAEGKLPEFIATCKTLLKKDWETVRAGAQKLSRASAVLHQLDPKLYPSADSWSHSQRNRDASISVSKVVKRTFELWGRRRKGKALVFIIDEVGQHVARSGDKIEDLRATIEEFGKVGKNLLKERKIIAPCWIVVTSQEKLDEVVAAIDSKRVELAKLQDRFRYRVDLAPSDIREVATKRVLAKKTEAEKPLKALFSENQGQLNAALRLERTTRRTDINESDFIHFYPYPPHYIDLCIGIMSGIRLQPGAPRHYGGSNRTIIKQAYEMLVSDRTAFAKKPIGALVTLDKVFELVEGNLSNERRTDIYQIAERFKNDPEDHGWALRVAKAICLLEFIRDLPRTEANLASVLVDEVGKATPLSEIQAAIKRLNTAQFIRNTEEGWKLQTAQEKNWETERRGHLEPKPRDRNELARTALQHIFDEPEFKTYRYQNRSFRIGISVDGTGIGDEGELALTLCVAEDADELTKRIEEIRTDSQQKSHENDLYWLFCLTPEIDELVGQLHASRKMVDKYNQLSAQQKISPDEATCLQDEKNSKNGYENRLRDKLTEAMERGTGKVAFDEAGRPSFNHLQNRRKGSLLYYYAFDILSHRGKSLLKAPWHDRRAILERALPSHPLLHLSASLESNAKTVIKAISEMKLEGVIAKQRTSCYEPGMRTGAWIKHRLYSGQELVIGGFTPGAHGIDAIAVGYYEGDRLIYVARTRNGFVPSTRRNLYERLKPLITKKCPFANLPEPRSYRWGEGMTEEKMAACVWVKPEVVAQINYVNWTDANHLRHSSFVGIREDKRARDVVKEYTGRARPPETCPLADPDRDRWKEQVRARYTGPDAN